MERLSAQDLTSVTGDARFGLEIAAIGFLDGTGLVDGSGVVSNPSRIEAASSARTYPRQLRPAWG